MATINATSSTNRANRMRMSKGRTLLLYSDVNTTSGAFLGAAIFVSRLSVSEFAATNPFTVG